MTEFLRNLPQFTGWSAKQISNILYKVETVNYIYKQTVIKQGEKDLYLYIVFDGEFEEYINIKLEKEIKFIWGERVSVAENKTPWKTQFSTLKKILRIAKYGQFINEDSVSTDGFATSTVTWISQNGWMYKIRMKTLETIFKIVK